jgi:hypothetical protein
VAIEPSSANSPSTQKPSGVAGDGAGRRHQAEGHGQVVMAAFLRQIGGGEIDGDALGRQRQADSVQRAANPLAALGHGLVGQADEAKWGRPGPICTCTSTARASMPSNATVVIRANIVEPPFRLPSL